MVPSALPPWPITAPAHGAVYLRQVRESDVLMAQELSTDPYVPQIGTLPLRATSEQALAWVQRQQGRFAEGAGFSYTVVETTTESAVGHCGLWLKELAAGRATAGYSIVPSARGRGLASDTLQALTEFGWTLPGLFRIALSIEPWNLGSIGVAERAGYTREGLLRSYQLVGDTRRDMLLYANLRPREAIAPDGEA